MVGALNLKAAVVKASSQTSGFLWLFMTFCFSNPGIRCFSMCFHHFAVPTCTGTFLFPLIGHRVQKNVLFFQWVDTILFLFFFLKKGIKAEFYAGPSLISAPLETTW